MRTRKEFEEVCGIRVEDWSTTDWTRYTVWLEDKITNLDDLFWKSVERNVHLEEQRDALKSECQSHKTQATILLDERNYFIDKLKGMLAIIHRDSGHYTEEHGIEKSYEDACTILHKWKFLPRDRMNELILAFSAGLFALRALPDYKTMGPQDYRDAMNVAFKKFLAEIEPYKLENTD